MDLIPRFESLVLPLNALEMGWSKADELFLRFIPRLEIKVRKFSQQGLDLIDLRRQLEGLILWDIWSNLGF